MQLSKIAHGLGALILVGLLPMAGTAGGAPFKPGPDDSGTALSVNPVIVHLDDAEDIQTVTLRNGGEDPIVMQAEASAWRVAGNSDRYSPTDKLVVTPPVFTLPPDETQIVRVGLEDPAPSDRERAYRIFLTQTPSPSKRDADAGDQPTAGLRLNLRVGLPVFVAPTAEPQAKVVWHAEREGDDGLSLRARNRGNAHFRLRRLEVTDEKGRVLAEASGPAYLLADSTRAWHLELDETASGPYQLHFWNRDGRHESTLQPD
jgi:fimbrial chaperone protein